MIRLIDSVEQLACHTEHSRSGNHTLLAAATPSLLFLRSRHHTKHGHVQLSLVTNVDWSFSHKRLTDLKWI